MPELVDAKLKLSEKEIDKVISSIGRDCGAHWSYVLSENIKEFHGLDFDDVLRQLHPDSSKAIDERIDKEYTYCHGDCEKLIINDDMAMPKPGTEDYMCAECVYERGLEDLYETGEDGHVSYGI